LIFDKETSSCLDLDHEPGNWGNLSSPGHRYSAQHEFKIYQESAGFTHEHSVEIMKARP
jgi:hypothetical protein